MPGPPKVRLHSKSSKHSNKRRPTAQATATNAEATVSRVDENTETQASTSNGSLNADQQFEIELCWCIQNLESSLESGKINAKQAQDTEKTIKMLKSAKQPTVKKRQIMRLAFGDYRAEMAAEERKMRLGKQQIHFTESLPKKCHFVRKSALATLGSDFKFDFQLPEIDKLHVNGKDDEKSTETDKIKENPIRLAVPDGNFKFNFNSELENK